MDWVYLIRVGRLFRKLTQNKEFRAVFLCQSMAHNPVVMQNPKSLRDLLSGPGKRLTALKTRSLQRSLVVDQVRAALPPLLAGAVTSAGIDQGRLTIGVSGAVWASRLRYSTEAVRQGVSGSTGVPILSVRIRVVPPGPKGY